MRLKLFQTVLIIVISVDTCESWIHKMAIL